MSTTTLRRLTECDTMLTHITTHYGTTIKRLRDALPGFPTQTPGNGSPGGGKGKTRASSITERLAEKPSTELTELRDAIHLPTAIAAATSLCAHGATILILDVPDGPRPTLRRLVWSRWLIRQLIEQQHPVPLTNLAQLHRRISDLHRITQRWGTPLRTPPRQELLPTDLTGMWCTNCLRIGTKTPRFRGDRCRWCYDFETFEHFPPPPDLLELRHRRKVYDRDVEPHRKAWREKNKRKKKRA